MGGGVARHVAERRCPAWRSLRLPRTKPPEERRGRRPLGRERKTRTRRRERTQTSSTSARVARALGPCRVGGAPWRSTPSEGRWHAGGAVAFRPHGNQAEARRAPWRFDPAVAGYLLGRPCCGCPRTSGGRRSVSTPPRNFLTWGGAVAFRPLCRTLGPEVGRRSVRPACWGPQVAGGRRSVSTPGALGRDLDGRSMCSSALIFGAVPKAHDPWGRPEGTRPQTENGKSGRGHAAHVPRGSPEGARSPKRENMGSHRK